MRKIPCFGNALSFEDYARLELLKNVGTHSIAVRDDFLKMCDEEGIEYEKKISKTESLDLLLQNGHTYAELAERFGVGVKSMVYQITVILNDWKNTGFFVLLVIMNFWHVDMLSTPLCTVLSNLPI